jgi:hypothetical protein
MPNSRKIRRLIQELGGGRGIRNTNILDHSQKYYRMLVTLHYPGDAATFAVYNCIDLFPGTYPSVSLDRDSDRWP